ncbi:MAG: ATP-binding protein [Planctomycetota bacterium]
MTAEAVQVDGQLASSDELGAVLRDYMAVTERLQQTHESLQREVVRLREELASKDRELELRRRLAALGELAAGVAHEVRNPLGAIQLYSNLLRGACQRLDPALELIEKIEIGIRAIDGVVQDTLALVPRDGRLSVEQLQAVISGARDLCQQVLHDHAVTLHTHLADPDVYVRVEADGLQRVLVNLMVNAVQASPAGGTVFVKVAAPCNGEVTLSVMDAGRGLADEVLDRLFDPFFTTKDHGTGLGLTIAHRLIEAYGGRLTARNRDSGGAEFMVVLPLAAGTDDNLVTEHNPRHPHAA